jgi:hypothetical protein
VTKRELMLLMVVIPILLLISYNNNSVYAVEVTQRFVGNIETVSTGLNNLFQPNDYFEGEFVYESGFTPPPSGDVANYPAIESFELYIEGNNPYSVLADDGVIEVQNRDPGSTSGPDGLWARSSTDEGAIITADPINEFSVDEITVALTDSSNQLLNDLSLPNEPFVNIGDFDFTMFTLSFANDEYISGPITDLQPNSDTCPEDGG